MIKNFKQLNYNITCTATISETCLEYIRFFSKEGTKKEYFADYMDCLIGSMKEKYPGKKLFFVLDNLASHCTSLVWKVLQEPVASLLFKPVHSP